MNATQIVIILILLSGVLPLAGLGRVTYRAWKDLPDPNRESVAEQMAEGERTGLFPAAPIINAARKVDIASVLEWRKVRWDLALVGGGIICGTSASIWGLSL